MATRAEFAKKLKDGGANADQIAKGFSIYRQSNGPFDDEAQAAPEPAPQESPSLYSAKTLFPGVTAAINQPDTPKDSAMVQSQLDIQKAAPIASQMIPGGMGMPMPVFSQKSMDAGLAAVGDYAGKAFRLAGALIPATRGKVPDAVTGQDRTRTFTEALQNPQGSLTTPIDEAVDKTLLPPIVKAATHFILGVVQGGASGIGTGAVKGAVKKTFAPAVSSTGKGLVTVADAVQNTRLGATTKDLLDGYTPRTLARYQMNSKSIPDAYHGFDAIKTNLQNQAMKLKGTSEAKVEFFKVLDDARQEIISKKYNRGEEQMLNALEEIRGTVTRQAIRDGREITARQPFVPRPPVSQLSPQQIADGVRNGELRFASRGGRAMPEYARPESPPTNFIPTPGNDQILHLDMMEGNKLKSQIGQDAAFLHLHGVAGHDQAASSAEKAYSIFYSHLKRAVDNVGPEELQAINKKFSEIIPAQNVLLRAMNKEQLGRVVGSTGVPTTKAGILKTAARITKTDRFSTVNAAGESLMATGEAAAAKSLSETVSESTVRGFAPGALKGALLNMGR